MIAYQ
jgi:hypothetical protein